jgi:hypothetical protein
MSRQRGARFFSEARDDIERPIRRPRTGCYLSEPQCRHARIFRRLKNSSISHGKCRSERSTEHLRPRGYGFHTPI